MQMYVRKLHPKYDETKRPHGLFRRFAHNRHSFPLPIRGCLILPTRKIPLYPTIGSSYRIELQPAPEVSPDPSARTGTYFVSTYLEVSRIHGNYCMCAENDSIIHDRLESHDQSVRLRWYPQPTILIHNCQTQSGIESGEPMTYRSPVSPWIHKFQDLGHWE